MTPKIEVFYIDFLFLPIYIHLFLLYTKKDGDTDFQVKEGLDLLC